CPALPALAARARPADRSGQRGSDRRARARPALRVVGRLWLRVEPRPRLYRARVSRGRPERSRVTRAPLVAECPGAGRTLAAAALDGRLACAVVVQTPARRDGGGCVRVRSGLACAARQDARRRSVAGPR